MAGYNKVADNTLSNWMAVLTGRNESRAYEVCNPDSTTALNNCDFIWKRFEDFGYITAFAEDDVRIATFNYLRKGFKDPPADYYFR